MSRADDLRAKYEADMAVLELEEELVAAKDADGHVPRELKEQLREARRAQRELRAGDPAAAGNAVATPDVVAAKAEVQEG